MALFRYREKAGPKWIHSKEKRLFDVGRALWRSPVYLALIAVTVAAIALDPKTKGSIVITQERVGQKGRPIKRFRKLRTMNCTTAENRTVAIGRSSWLARMLAALSLDELLQVWNVLKGEMAFIGPRTLLEATYEAMRTMGKDGKPLPADLDWKERLAQAEFSPIEIADMELVQTVPKGGIFGAHYPSCRQFADGSPAEFRNRLTTGLWYYHNASRTVDKELMRETGRFLRKQLGAEIRALRGRTVR